MSCYAVIDTNVLVSALLSDKDDTATVQVVARIFSGEIIPVYSSAMMAEYHDVLHREKFCFSPDIVNHLLLAFGKFGMMVEPVPSGAVLPDMPDLAFYEATLAAQGDGAWLVTGNLEHFPRIPFAVTARQLLEKLEENGEYC